jgi:hypothetical protein
VLGPNPLHLSGIQRVRWGSVWLGKGTSMSDLEDLIRRVNRDLEEHRQVDASRRAMAERRRLPAEQEGGVKRYSWLPLVLAVVTVIGVFAGVTAVLLTVLGD